MKTVIFSLLLLSSTTLLAQVNRNNDDRRPMAVRRSFERDYPSVTNVQWGLRNGQWEGTYRDNNNRQVMVHYDRYGRRIDSHIAWDRNEVPQDIDRSVNRRYHANSNYQVFKIERPRSQPLFQIRIGTRRPIYMDERGRERKYYDHH